MPVNIDVFKRTAEFISNKTQSGNTTTAAQFNLLANAAQLQVFEKDRLIFLKTGESSDYLDWFLKNLTLNPDLTTGYLPYPSDYQHTSAVRSYYVKPKQRSVEVKVNQVKNTDWGAIGSSTLQKPTKRFPKYTEFKDEYRFLPKDIGIVMLDYYKTPVAPVWGFTIANNEEVYDPTTSTDFEWADAFFGEVMAVYVGFLGINLLEPELEQYAEMQKKETNSLL